MFTVTNNHARPVLSAWDLTDAERSDLDYVDWEAVDRGEESWNGFRYRGSLYDLREFEAVRRPSASLYGAWDGYQTSSYFDAVAVRFVDGGDGDEYGHVVVAHLHW